MNPRALTCLLAATALLLVAGCPWTPHDGAAPAAPARPAPPGGAGRIEPPADPPSRAPVVAEPAPSLAEFVVRLVDLGVQLSAAAEAGERDRVERLDRRSRFELAALYRSYPGPELAALDSLAALDPAAAGLRAEVRRRVWLLLVTEGLERRWRRAEATGIRRHLDAFVSALLAAVVRNQRLATELGMQLLVERPYLGLAHEDQVLELVAASDARPFLREVGTGLLLTLWNNLAESGARQEGELASLALLFRDDLNPSRRLAAYEHLLLAGGGRYVDLVLDEVVSGRDRHLARELAILAATSLGPTTAIDVLDRLVEVGGDELTPAFLTLGRRDAQALRAAYEQALADGVRPALRAGLVTGSGFSDSTDGIEVARLALHADPDPRVRTRALFALTARTPLAWGRQAVESALSDPVLRSDPRHLGAISWAIRNLADAGLAEPALELGNRLLATPGLLPADRQQLAGALAQLPRAGAPDKEPPDQG